MSLETLIPILLLAAAAALLVVLSTRLKAGG